MKIQFEVYEILLKEIHVPSEDFYRSSGDSMTSDIQILEYHSTFDTKPKAIEYIKELYESHIQRSDKKTPKFTILEVFQF